jgi:hypothetical protein
VICRGGPFKIGTKEWLATSTTSRGVVNVTNLQTIMEFPPQTFYKYIKPTNPRILGDGSRGKKKWFTNDGVKFVGCVLARADR